MLKISISVMWILFNMVPLCMASEPIWMLRLHPKEFKTLLPEINSLTNLKGVDLSGNEYELINSIIENIAGLKQIEALDLSRNGLLIIPKQVYSLSRLKQLNLAQNQLKTIPSKLFITLTKLEEINLSGNLIEELPIEIGEPQQLIYLNLESNKIKRLPNQIWKLSLLKKMNLAKNSLSGLSGDIGRLSALVNLDLGGNKLTTLPDELAELSALESLDISWNQINSIPNFISTLPRLRCLKYDFNPLLDPAELSWLQSFSNCTEERIQVLINSFSAPRIESDIVNLESKNSLLILLIRELLEKYFQSIITAYDFLRYEAENPSRDLQHKVENRLTFLNFLLSFSETEILYKTNEILDDYKAFAETNWITLNMSKKDAEVSPFNDYHRNIFEWQFNSSKIIFWMVIIIVITGLVFSGIQFFASLKITKFLASREACKQQIKSPTSQDRTEIEISLQAIKIKTSLIGVVILSISLAFFYLYLKYVYPINLIKPTN